LTICGKCGHHTFFAHDRCPCGEELHVKGCSKAPGVCKCHDENKSIWEKAHPQPKPLVMKKKEVKNDTK